MLLQRILVPLLCIFYLAPLANGLTTIRQFGRLTHTSRELKLELDSKMTCFVELLDSENRLNVWLESAEMGNEEMHMRISTPEGDSEWYRDKSVVRYERSVTAQGEYEFCIYSPRPKRVLLRIQFSLPLTGEGGLDLWLEQHNLGKNIQNAVENIYKSIGQIFFGLKIYNIHVERDTNAQERNNHAIKQYVIVFCVLYIGAALIQVFVVRRFFRIDERKIRI